MATKRPDRGREPGPNPPPPPPEPQPENDPGDSVIDLSLPDLADEFLAGPQGAEEEPSAISAIPELIVDGETGLLVPAEDIGELSVALNRLIVDPALRNRLGNRAAARVRQDFGMSRGIAELAKRFGLAA